MILSDDEIDGFLDDVLKASGSRLRHYSMHSTTTAMRAATRAVERATIERLAAMGVEIPESARHDAGAR